MGTCFPSPHNNTTHPPHTHAPPSLTRTPPPFPSHRLVACTDPTLPEDSPLRYNSPGLEGWADAFKGRLLQRRLQPNMRTHALLVEAHAWEGEEDVCGGAMVVVSW